MKHCRTYCIYFFACIGLSTLLSFSFAGDDWKTITLPEVEKEMKGIEDFYASNPNYAFSLVYSSYKGHQSLVPFEKMEGSVKKQGLLYSSFVLGIQTIQNNKIKVVIDTAEQTIAIADADKELKPDVIPVNAAMAKKQITACRLKENGAEKTIRIEFSKSYSCTAEEIRIGTDHRLKEIIIYYSKSYPVDEDDPSSAKAQPKASILINNFVLNPKLDAAKEFNTAKYVVADAKDKLTLTNAYHDYQLMDLRVSKKLK